MKIQAIALCRVSTADQKLNNSLNRQGENVLKAATELGVDIVKSWSGDVSSKAGTNVKRKDLNEMLAYSKQNKAVKYLIVDEPDRFMRSIDEAFYFEVAFQQLGVKVWYASDPLLNTGDLMSKMLKFSKYFPAEGSNVERQTKSISGHETAIREGRYTFNTKPGYVKGTLPGVHVRHPQTFIPLQKAFKEVAGGLYTPQEALKRLNDSEFGKVHSHWNMDKFRQFSTDPYYAGIIEKDLQVKARNNSGQHEAMIALEDHEELVRMFNSSLKQRGPRKQYNPEFPLNKILLCDDCGNEVKFTGSKKNNGYAKKTTKYYYKYHCRGCGKAYHRNEVHELLTEKLRQLHMPTSSRKDIIEALAYVWGQKKEDEISNISSLSSRVANLEATKSKLVREMIKVDDRFKKDIEKEIDSVKEEIEQTTTKINGSRELEDDLVDFVKFGLEYSNDAAEDWWNLDHESRVRCQQLIFPGGISFNAQKKVGTPRLSPFYSLEPNKKALRIDRKALMVELPGTAPGSASLSLLAVYRYSLLSCLRDGPQNRPKSTSSRL